ncbi:MAG: IPT/TIG domain-containing protein [Jatrophihabitans sp.]|uniref:IPT/TIG domain-containing protein n=1 Tax=Jatrophihabitans sp. TaxID=1932789 RepID=UPI003F7FFEDC
MTIRINTAGKRAAAVAAVAGTVVAGVFGMSGSANATSTTPTITKLSVHRIATSIGNQLIVVTGTNFDENTISNVKLVDTQNSNASVCTTAPTYIVASPTSLLVKTANDCAVAKSKVGVDIHPTSGSDIVSDPTVAAMALDLVAPPTLFDDDTSVPDAPVFLVNGGSAAPVTVAPMSGGQIVEVKGDGTYHFTTSTAYPLKASIGGVPLTNLALGGCTAGTNCTYFTGKLGSYKAVPANNDLVITANGVTATYHSGSGNSGCVAASSCTGTTHTFTIGDDQLIKLSTPSVPLTGGTITVNGKGFKAATPTVAITGATHATCSNVTVVSDTKLTCDAPANTAGAYPVDVTVGTTHTLDNGTNYLVYSAY